MCAAGFAASRPRSVDLWRGVQIGAPVAEARAVNDLKAYALINAADAQGRDNDDAMAPLRTIDGIEPLETVIVRRKAFPNAFTAGFSVIEQRPQDPKAVEELLYTVHTLYPQGTHNGHQNAVRQAGFCRAESRRVHLRGRGAKSRVAGARAHEQDVHQHAHQHRLAAQNRRLS
jgi:hypothetical protein